MPLLIAITLAVLAHTKYYAKSLQNLAPMASEAQLNDLERKLEEKIKRIEKASAASLGG